VKGLLVRERIAVIAERGAQVVSRRAHRPDRTNT
jgi:hypothetical protein